MIQRERHTCKIEFSANTATGFGLETSVVKMSGIWEREMDGQWKDLFVERDRVLMLLIVLTESSLM
jgi:hypothetical protein